MQQKKIRNRILVFLFVFMVLCAQAGSAISVYASDFSFYNHNTKSNVKYTGKQVSYDYNGKNINLTYPGIILSGYALADYEELFVNQLGLSATLKEKALTLSDGNTTLELTIGSKNVKINGVSQKMSIAPVKLEFDAGIIKYYVPTRFVAETFGINYVWNSKNSHVKLTKTLKLQVNGKSILYNDAFFTASYNTKEIASRESLILFNDVIYAPVKPVFEALGCKYTEEPENGFSVTKDNIIIQFKTGSYHVTVNEIPFEMEAAPIMVSGSKDAAQQVYVPFEFVIKTLGFKAEFDESTYHFTINDTEYTGTPEEHPELKEFFHTQIIYHDQEPIETYFLWSAEEDSDLEGIKNLYKIRAYSIENADVIELYGITRDDVYDFIDNRAIVFEMKNVLSNMDTKFFGNFDTPHLNYVLLTTINLTTKLFIMAPIEDEWVFEETKECLKIYFMSSELEVEDLKILEEQNYKTLENTIEKTYPEDRFYIKLPEGFNPETIEITDDYQNKEITLKIPGNLTDYFEKYAPVHQYDFVKKITISYDASEDKTILTCSTTYICGYKADNKDHYFALTLGKPSEIYDKIIVLDAGHGGKDPGAVHDKVYEKNINFSILSYTQDLFANSDIKVYYTRTKDKFISLQDRTKFVKEVEADLFISLHMNASELEAAAGTEIFYSKANNSATEYGLTSYKLGKALIGNITAAMNSKSRGVSKSEYYVVENNSVPAVLIELGFISNNAERKKLVNTTYQKNVAQAIYDSVIEIFCTYPTGR